MRNIKKERKKNYREKKARGRDRKREKGKNGSKVRKKGERSKEKIESILISYLIIIIK